MILLVWLEDDEVDVSQLVVVLCEEVLEAVVPLDRDEVLVLLPVE